MTVEAVVGTAAEGYDVERDWETGASTAFVDLYDGMTAIGLDISEDGEEHVHLDHLPDAAPW